MKRIVFRAVAAGGAAFAAKRLVRKLHSHCRELMHGSGERSCCQPH
jgi:hypothetical protein